MKRIVVTAASAGWWILNILRSLYLKEFCLFCTTPYGLDTDRLLRWRPFVRRVNLLYDVWLIFCMAGGLLQQPLTAAESKYLMYIIGIR